MKRILIFLFILLILCSTISVADDTKTIVYIDDIIVEEEGSFNISINCIPAEPVKGWELKILFNSTLLQANKVYCGNIFSGYNQFFSPGIIDNNAGTIINIYNLIIGQGNIIDPGTLIIINFTTNGIHGKTFIELYNVGVANESPAYVPLTIINGSVQIGEDQQEFVTCWKCINDTLESREFPFGTVCEEIGWKSEPLLCIPSTPGFELIILIFALFFVLFRKMRA